MKITKGTVVVNGKTYKAFQNTYTKLWYIVEGVSCMDKIVWNGLKAKSAKNALEPESTMKVAQIKEKYHDYTRIC